MNVVFDASTIVSAAIKPDRIPERALLRALEAPYQVLMSREVEAEYREVLLRPKFDRYVSRERREAILTLISAAAEWIESIEEVRECRDPKDDKYLALALSGAAQMIISSDVRHLLLMHPWRGISIVLPADFLSYSS